MCAGLREQLGRLNIEFSPALPEDGFKDFFEKELPAEVNNSAKGLITAEWDREPFEADDPLHRQLLEDAFKYQLSSSDDSVQNCARTLFRIFNVESIREKQATDFGVADMVVSKDPDLDLHNCVIENKSGTKYSDRRRRKYSLQLAIHMLSIASKNSEFFRKQHNKYFDYQNILGILHYGLTPIFYKVKITEEYLQAVQALCRTEQTVLIANFPTLVFKEYIPIKLPNCDRELLLNKSRPILFKCYEAFKELSEKYMNEKMSVLSEDNVTENNVNNTD